MESGQKKLRFRVNRALISVLMIFILFLSFQSVEAGGNSGAEFFDNYKLSQREKCEIYRSILNRISSNEHEEICSKVVTFKAVRSLKPNKALREQSIYLSSTKDDDWSLIDVSIKTELKGDVLNIKDLVVNDFSFNISEYLFGYKGDYNSIEIGSIGEVIIIQLKDQSILQLSIIPTQCENEGLIYTDYSVFQVFSWYPPMQGASYSKAFFKSPICI